MSKITECCEAMAECQESLAIEVTFDGGVGISGCCGSQCYVVTGIEFCPFCGTKILIIETEVTWELIKR